jgi:hypothetical protein
MGPGAVVQMATPHCKAGLEAKEEL